MVIMITRIYHTRAILMCVIKIWFRSCVFVLIIYVAMHCYNDNIVERALLLDIEEIHCTNILGYVYIII